LEKKNTKLARILALILFLIIVTLVVLFLAIQVERQITQAEPEASPTSTPEPIVPTRTPGLTVAEKTTPTEPATSTPGMSTPMTSTAAHDQAQISGQVPETPLLIGSSDLVRYGVTGGVGDATSAFDAGLLFGSLLNWLVEVNPPQNKFVYWQMVRIDEDGIRRTTWEEIEQAIQANPGSFWLVGNEPDVLWQDNVTPQRYAEIYQEVFSFVKSRDPSAKIVIGGVSQPTPLRRAYLDLVLDSYQQTFGRSMPIDIWNVHAFTLREEQDSWGVGIPPGMEGSSGILYEIEDHDNLNIMKQNLIDFRAWMAERGYGDKPLVVSEYGILMPEDYGFPPEVVGSFLTESIDIFRTLANETGYSPDEGRLVQWWFWFSIYDDDLYPTGNLFDPLNQELTPLGHTWAEYVAGSRTNQ